MPTLDDATANADAGAGVTVVRGPIGSAPEADAVLVGPTDRVGHTELVGMPRLRVVAVAGAGTDAVDEAALEHRGIRLVSAPTTTAGPTAELTMSLMLLVSRGVLPAMAELTTGRWTGWSFDHIAGRGLDGLTLGLVGYGRIGRRVEALAGAFGMHVLHHARRDTGRPGYYANLREMLSRSDVVSIHLPLTAATTGLIDAAALAAVPAGAALINTSRGGIVDEGALVDALASGHLSGAGLDVFAAEPAVPDNLLSVPNLVVTSHIGTATRNARDAMVREASEALLAALDPAEPGG